MSAVAAAVILGGATILGSDDDDGDDANSDLNMSAVLLDTAADAATAAGVAITGAIIFVTGRLYWLDPAVALVISAIVAYHAIRLTRRVTVALSLTHPK